MLYTLLAPVYRELFPLRQEELRLCLEGASADMRVLDIGCGDGALVQALCKEGCDAIGVDLDAGMIKTAEEHLPGRFHCLDARDLHTLAGPFDLFCCLGNSLSYLKEDDVQKMLMVLRKIGSQGARLVLQTVNWDRVLTGRFPGFPSRSIKGWGRFEREYTEASVDRICFRTHVLLESGKRHEFCDTLYPLRKGRLLELLGSAGWTGVESFGAFDRSPWHTDAPATIVRTVSMS